MPDYDLNRFIEAQKFPYNHALAEIQAGRKRTHWMWYIFPQLKVLGRSSTALHYGIAGIDEAKAYMAELGNRIPRRSEAPFMYDTF